IIRTNQTQEPIHHHYRWKICERNVAVWKNMAGGIQIRAECLVSDRGGFRCCQKTFVGAKRSRYPPALNHPQSQSSARLIVTTDHDLRSSCQAHLRGCRHWQMAGHSPSGNWCRKAIRAQLTGRKNLLRPALPPDVKGEEARGQGIVDKGWQAASGKKIIGDSQKTGERGKNVFSILT